MSKRSLLYTNPKLYPIEFSKLYNISDSDPNILTISIDPNQSVYSAKQIKYSFSNDVIPSSLKDIGIFHITWRKENITTTTTTNNNNNSISSSLLYEWNNWIPTGLTINVAPQNTNTWKYYYLNSIDFINSLFNILDLPINSHKPVFQKEWYTYNIELNNPNINLILNNWLKINNLIINDNDNDINNDSLDAFEIILNNNLLNIYFYYTNENANSISLNKNLNLIQELALITEMENINNLDNSLNADRFVQGLNGNLIDNEFKLSSIMFYFSNYISNNNLSFNININQLKNPSLHPIIDYKINNNFNNNKLLNIYPNDPSILNNLNCSLHLETILSNDYIIDKYEIQRIINNNNNNKNDFCIKNLNYISNNGMDLELPSYKINEWSNIIDLTIDESCILLNNGEFHLPIHLRYSLPNLNDNFNSLKNPLNSLYWECPIDNETSYQISKSFYTDDGRFSILDDENGKFSTRRYYFQQDKSSLNYTVLAPSGNLSYEKEIDSITALIVIFGTLFLFKCCFYK
jgi:hypothetical protein